MHELTSDLESSVVLGMAWEYYVSRGCIYKPEAYIERMKSIYTLNSVETDMILASQTACT